MQGKMMRFLRIILKGTLLIPFSFLLRRGGFMAGAQAAIMDHETVLLRVTARYNISV